MRDDDNSDFMYGNDGTLEQFDDQTNVEDLFNSEEFDDNDDVGSS